MFSKPFVGLLFLFLPGYSLANICLHPLELAALQHSKPQDNSIEARLERANEKKEKIEKDIEDLQDKVKEQRVLLENSLKDDKQTYHKHKIFYIEEMAKFNL